LFVCTANICRSPYAELYATQRTELLELPLDADSTGVHGFDQEPMDPPMRRRLEAIGGVDPGFKSKTLDRQQVDWADLILCMETAHRNSVLEEYPHVVSKLFTFGQFNKRLPYVAGEGTALVNAIATTRGPANPDDDVADPYRRGNRAAKACADQLNDLLEELIPRIAVEVD